MATVLFLVQKDLRYDRSLISYRFYKYETEAEQERKARERKDAIEANEKMLERMRDVNARAAADRIALDAFRDEQLALKAAESVPEAAKVSSDSNAESETVAAVTSTGTKRRASDSVGREGHNTRCRKQRA
ncbi:hypothetical protein MBM_04385 [Drepanopeziza brunnea f. sp. 'multigermtubi' MB_m1]|uniref:Uncharacterized protein n=1 Tax=Marssonina brunnea f. sp. multigermtubi (strain MB_m1) TaxID=1072389 RepID=K1XXJ4_MARBU|nr:uncharacterized protein MBM_04385 [Drepanopeziza brunnea f. sp. 'multigermtubi' MB_m1]EKD17524.1 hypothetical protein MBM_04385 [Drepanopeziza brunnea f. sp. 'multigermtubi' MB_m1]